MAAGFFASSRRGRCSRLMAFVSDGYSYLLHTFCFLFSERAHVVAPHLFVVVFPPFSVASVGSHLFFPLRFTRLDYVSGYDNFVNELATRMTRLLPQGTG